jgi:multiple sugar transport system substrate-binding protein
LPFEGVSLAVVTLQAGERGAISGGILNWVPAFNELTGADVQVVQRPFNDIAPVMFNDLRTGTGAYDGFIPPMSFLGDVVAGDFAIPINDYMGDSRFPRWTEDLEPADDPRQWAQDIALPNLSTIYRWDDSWYAVPWDADSHVLYYRKDVLEDADVQAAYLEATGNELVVPNTVDQFVEQACYFNGTDPLGTGQALSGIVLPGALNSQLFDFYKDIAAQYVVVAGGSGDGFSETFNFNPETMEPLINSPAHVRGLETLVQLFECGPANGPSIDLGTSFNLFVQGTAVFQYNFGDTGTLVQDPSTNSPVKGHLGVTTLPGATEVWNFRDGAWVTLEEPNTIGNLAGASWSGIISAFTSNPDAVYTLFAFLGTPTMGEWSAKWGFNGIDIGRPQHFLPPDGTADIAMYLDTGFDEADIREMSRAYHRNYTGTVYEYLQIPGTPEYNLVLEQEVQAVISGQAEPQAALDRVAQRWAEITGRLGSQDQIEYFQESIR